MKQFQHIIIVCTLALFAVSCNTNPTLNEENLQGTWTCFDFTMTGGNISPEMVSITKEISMQTTHEFTKNTLILTNPILQLGFSYTIENNSIHCTPIGFNDVTTRTYTVKDFTETVLVLEETMQDIQAVTYLRRDTK